MNISLSSLCSHLHLKPEHTALLDERDTSDVWRQFAIWLLVDPDDGVLRFAKPGTLQYKAIQRVAQLYIEHCKDADTWKAAASVAAYADAAAAYDAAYAAWFAAAYRATDAAWCAAATASSAAATAAAWFAAATHAAYDERMGHKLIELLQTAPMMK